MSATRAKANAELHLREPKRQPLVTDCDAVAAGQRQLESAAEGKPMNRRNRGGWQCREAVDDLLTAVDQREAEGGRDGDAGPLRVDAAMGKDEQGDRRGRHAAKGEPPWGGL